MAYICSTVRTDEPTHIDDTGVLGDPLRGDVAANGEARVAVRLAILNIIAPSDWHIVNDPGRKKKKKSAKPVLRPRFIALTFLRN